MSGSSWRIALRGHQTFVGVRRRHPDVHHRHVRSVQPDEAEQSGGVLRLTEDLDAGFLKQADDALPREEHVIGNHYAHGISARLTFGPTSSVPPSAPMRSADRTRGSGTPGPSSSTVTTRTPSPATGSHRDDGRPPSRGVLDALEDQVVRRGLDGSGEALPGDLAA